jgi:peptidoglycan hydrolase-like protein with peptidoglycan-binding domain
LNTDTPEILKLNGRDIPAEAELHAPVLVQQNRRGLLVSIGLVLLITAGIGIGVGLGGEKSDDITEPAISTEPASVSPPTIVETVKSIPIEAPPDEISVKTTLVYAKERNQYWNAKCPKTLTKNEQLPLVMCQKGEGIKLVQLLIGVEADGFFGNDTFNALIDFQVSEGLEPTGVVDEETWFALDRSQSGPGFDENGDGLVTPNEFQ